MYLLGDSWYSLGYDDMSIKQILRKILYVAFWDIFYVNIPLTFFLLEFYDDFINVIGIILLIIVDLADTFARPFPKKKRSTQEELDRYTLLLLIVFLSSPFIFMVAYVENQVLIQPYLPLFNSVWIGIIGLE